MPEISEEYFLIMTMTMMTMMTVIIIMHHVSLPRHDINQKATIITMFYPIKLVG